MTDTELKTLIEETAEATANKVINKLKNTVRQAEAVSSSPFRSSALHRMRIHPLRS